MPAKTKFFALTAAMFTLSCHAATSNFLFGSGIPFGGSTVVDGVVVTLTTTNTEPFGSDSFRDTTTQEPATVTFAFDWPVTSFSMSVTRVHPEEWLGDFSLGTPSALSDTLILSNDRVTTSGSDDFGYGSLSWSGIAATSISFTIGNFANPQQPEGTALSVDTFSITAVPETGSGLMLASGGLVILGVAWCRRKGANRTIDA